MKSWTTETTVGQHGNSLVVNVTQGCRLMNLTRGSIVKITIESTRTERYADTIEGAKKIIKTFEKEDRNEGSYEPNYYEIYDNNNNEIIE